MAQQPRARVAVLADATPETGTGHVMRSLALAEAMRSQGSDVLWISQMTVPWLRSYFEDGKHLVRNGSITSADAVATLIEAQVDIAVVDTYADVSYQIAQMERAGIRVVQVFDGFGTPTESASLLLNPEAPLETGVDSRVPPVALNGPEYALIRQEIRDLAKSRFEEGVATSQSGEDRRAPFIVIIAGGGDAERLLDVAAWTAVAEALEMRVVLGPGGSGISAIQESREAKGGVSLKCGSNLLRDAAVADWVISASGVTSWELMHIGVPTGLFCVSGNQRRNFEYMTSRGWALDMDDLVAGVASRFSAQLWRKARDHFMRKRWQEQRVDGLGASRAAAAVVQSRAR